ncbi:energy transducer TonB [Tateyamaria omphalii]|uniref:Energy transducer TonB n=1 Tax=Tateyamaria omphalii TaxID=299262 RepID=A0A1P8MVQ7_9RHOB|nr:energy transducer TonB [Tateyamaria omphalii]APX12101.1 energy transducer TonB [Tateyamaria omphalii]
MNTGQVISGIGHAGLIGWMLFGGSFQSEPLPFEVTEVSVISSDAFEALLPSGPAPDTATDVALPVQPDVAPDPVETPVPDEAVEAEPPEPSPAPEPDVVPEPPAPEPEPEVADDAPVQPAPQDQAVVVPEVAPRPVPRQAERVAPDPVAPPEPEAAPDDVQQDAVTESETGETQAEEQEATAPEEATTEIVTEAEEPTGAPTASLRPPARRPSPPVQTAEPAPAPETPSTPAAEPADTSDDVNDALREALGGAEVNVPQGPPLSAGEKDALRVAVSNCWNVGSLSSEALQTTVVVTVDMSQDGTPVIPSIRLASSSGGSQAAAQQAFEAARRAIIRCTRDGYDLPAEKYGQWKEIEMTFNPERMRIK